MWGYPPWLTINTTDCEMAEKSMMTVLRKDFWNSSSALFPLSSSGK